jgi:MFS transporter, UMF1 family
MYGCSIEARAAYVRRADTVLEERNRLNPGRSARTRPAPSQSRRRAFDFLWKYSTFEAGDSAWSLMIVSTYFGAYLQAVFKRPAADFGWAVTTGALVIAAISPILGAAADRSGRRQPYLRAFVFGAVLSTIAIGWAPSAAAALLLFTTAYICVNGAFTFFTALTPAVSDEHDVARVVSATVGIGYAGALLCLLSLAGLVLTGRTAGRIFLPMGIIYLACAVPAMYLAPDFQARSGVRLGLRAAYQRVGQTFREARRYRHALTFLVGDFLYENAIASVITLMGLYARNRMGFEVGELRALFGPAIVVAMLSAVGVFGPLIRAVGPKKAVLFDLAIWLLLFGLVLAIRPQTALNVGALHVGSKTVFALTVAPLAGMGLAGVWSSSRVLLTALTPVAKSGEFWGLYNLSGRSASVLGDATWSTILTVFGERTLGYDIAVVALALYVLLGAVLIATLPDARPSSANFVGEEEIRE